MLTWIDLVFKPFVILATIYWLVWHKREGRRMVREEETFYAPASELKTLAVHVAGLAEKKDLLLLEAKLETQRLESKQAINEIYAQMRTDANTVGTTLRTLTGEIGKLAGQLDAELRHSTAGHGKSSRPG